MAAINIEVVQRQTSIAVEQKTAAQIAVEAKKPAVVIEVPRGAPPPPTDSSNVMLLQAGETISGGKTVVIETDGKVYVYDITDENQYGKSAGIAKQGALQGEPLEVYIGGVAYEAGSGWQTGLVYYVSSTGLPSTIAPDSGIIKIIGVGIGPDKILLNSETEFITI